MGVRRFRNMRSCSVNLPGGTMFTLKAPSASEVSFTKDLVLKLDGNPRAVKCETTRARRPSLWSISAKLQTQVTTMTCGLRHDARRTCTQISSELDEEACNQEELQSPHRLPFAGIVSHASLPDLFWQRLKPPGQPHSMCNSIPKPRRRRSVSQGAKYVRPLSLSQTAHLTNRASASEETAIGAGGRGVVFQNTIVFSSHGF